MQGFYDAAAAGELSPAALVGIEKRLLPELAQAERQARPSRLPAVVDELVGADVERRWTELALSQQRAVVSALMTVRILPTRPGRRSFDPDAISIEWRTW
ncbi:MAG: hypothetical protein ACM3ZF_16105 [Mycobacterium leprae]